MGYGDSDLAAMVARQGFASDGDEASLPIKALIVALIVHLVLLTALHTARNPVIPWDKVKFVPVDVITVQPPAPISAPLPERPPVTEPSAPVIPPVPTQPTLPDIAPPPVAPINDLPIISATPSELITDREATGSEAAAAPSTPTQRSGDYTGSRWALQPPLARDNLEKGWADDVDCLQSLSPDCAAMRKEVFAEYQMSETDKVWTERRADTGMPSEFYGMSEREIRLKVGSKIAGENGLMLLPGIGIDGQLWDMLHGVKKGCKMKRGINSDGQYDVVRICPDSLPSAKNRKYHIPSRDTP